MKKLFSIILIPSLLLFFIAGCSNDDEKSKTFVLVHGAWQASYVWTKVKQQLESKGQKVVLVELPGHGTDFTPPVALTINAYRDKVIGALNSIEGKVILVGHSMGGVVVSAVAEMAPSRIEKLVYIGAFVPANGESLLGLALRDQQSLLGPALRPSADQLSLDVVEESLVKIFCADCSDADKQLLQDKYRSEPAIPFTNKAVLTNANFGTVKKYYIHTLQDSAIGINNQQAMAATANISQTYSINSSHSPFLSMPLEVSTLLFAISR